jgi:hypothetical protein
MSRVLRLFLGPACLDERFRGGRGMERPWWLCWMMLAASVWEVVEWLESMSRADARGVERCVGVWGGFLDCLCAPDGST